MFHQITENDFEVHWTHFEKYIDDNVIYFIGANPQTESLYEYTLNEIRSFNLYLYFVKEKGYVLINKTNFKYSEMNVKFISFTENVDWIENYVKAIENSKKFSNIGMSDIIKIELEYDWKNIRRCLSRELGYKVDHILFAKELTYE